MKCLLCAKFSLKIICMHCLDCIDVNLRKRVGSDGFVVYSFFDYSNIEFLLKSKYTLIGSRIYKSLSLKAASYMPKLDSNDIYGIGIDDRALEYYSHSGIIVRCFSNIVAPLYGVFVATNDVSYAGKSLEFRRQNKKHFKYSGKNNINAILFDDVVTTGTSIDEAREVLLSNGVNVLFALVLSDARF